MKKTLKIICISLASLITLLIISIFIILWFVVTPEKLTPMVRNQTEKFISCKTNFKTVDVTFFSTFPHIGIQIKNVALINPMPQATSDTLAYIGEITASLNLSELLKNNALKLTTVKLEDVVAHLYVDKNGKLNYDIFISDTTDQDSTFTLPFDLINVRKIKINNLQVSYTNDSSKMYTSINDVNAFIKGELTEEDAWANIKLESGKIRFQIQDSLPVYIALEGFSTKIKGEKEGNFISGNIEMKTPASTLQLHNNNYLRSMPLAFEIPFRLDLDKKTITLDQAEIEFNTFKLSVDGFAKQSSISDDISLDVAFETNTWNLPALLNMLPDNYKNIVEGMSFKGDVKVKGSAKGVYNDSLMPLINAQIHYTDGNFAYKNLPLSFKNIEADLTAFLDFNNETQSRIAIHSLEAETGQSSLHINGDIKDFFNAMLFQVRIKGKLFLPDVKPMLPSDMKIDVKGISDINIVAGFELNDLRNFAYEKWHVNGNFDFTQLAIKYKDSIFITSSASTLKLTLPSRVKDKKFIRLFDTEVHGKDLDVRMIDGIHTNLENYTIKAGISDFRDTNKLIAVQCVFAIGLTRADMDTVSATIDNMAGTCTMLPSVKNKNNPDIQFTYSNKKISAQMGSFLSFTGDAIKFHGKGVYDNTEKEMLLQWAPNLNATIQNGILEMSSLFVPVQIPLIQFDFTPEKMVIDKSSLILDKSSFSLSGTVTNINNYFKKTGLLVGDLNFVSDNTNINQLKNIVSGFGASDTTSAEYQEVTGKEDDPFMVPLGVDIKLHTWIKNAIVGQTEIQNVQGSLTVKDGVMVLDQIGFTCDAARMQLTAMYKSPRKNHLFAGIDFHLLDVDIEKLIAMIPELDTLVPMLKSFAGKAEFHLEAQTNLKSNYELKMSTLRASAALEGHDLVLLDNETFSEISKQLLFDKKTMNKVDSISVELTVFKDQIDIYPFLIVMDKYKAVISGRHNLDMTFDYHISLTDCPLPTRLGLDVKGKIGELKYKLVPCKYGNLYRPDKQNIVEKRTLELKKIISDALKAKVKE